MSNIDPATTGTNDPTSAGTTPGTIGGVDETEAFERDPFSDLGGDGEGELDEVRYEDWGDVEEHRQDVLEQQQIERDEAEAERQAEIAEQEAAEAEAAAQAAAAAAGEPYHLGSSEIDGEPVETFLMPDGCVYVVDADGEVVSVAFPEEPEFMGHVYSDGSSLDVFELYNGDQVVVQDGQLVGSLDEVEHDTIPVDPFIAQMQGWGSDVSEVYTVPMGAPSYDTHVVDAATGEIVGELDTGIDPSEYGIQTDGYAIYQPPGSDYRMHIHEGEVHSVVPIPEEPEWSFLGIIEYYEDGTVSLDLAIVEIDVDMIGDEKGVSVGVDLLFIEVSAGVDWDSDGNWDFEASIDVDVPGVGELGGSLEASWDEGEFSAAVDGYVSVQFGALELGAAGGVGLEFGPDGLEATAHGEVTAVGEFLGTELELGLGGSVTVNEQGVTGEAGAWATAETDLFGGFEAGLSVDTEAGAQAWAGRPEDEPGEDHGYDQDTSWQEDLDTEFETTDEATGVDAPIVDADVDRTATQRSGGPEGDAGADRVWTDWRTDPLHDGDAGREPDADGVWKAPANDRLRDAFDGPSGDGVVMSGGSTMARDQEPPVGDAAPTDDQVVFEPNGERVRDVFDTDAPERGDATEVAEVTGDRRAEFLEMDVDNVVMSGGSTMARDDADDMAPTRRDLAEERRPADPIEPETDERRPTVEAEGVVMSGGSTMARDIEPTTEPANEPDPATASDAPDPTDVELPEVGLISDDVLHTATDPDPGPVDDLDTTRLDDPDDTVA